MHQEFLEIKNIRRRLNLESDFFLQGNLASYMSILQRHSDQTPKPQDSSCSIEELVQSMSKNPIICGEVGCNQSFLNLKKVSTKYNTGNQKLCAR